MIHFFLLVLAIENPYKSANTENRDNDHKFHYVPPFRANMKMLIRIKAIPSIPKPILKNKGMSLKK